MARIILSIIYCIVVLQVSNGCASSSSIPGETVLVQLPNAVMMCGIFRGYVVDDICSCGACQGLEVSAKTDIIALSKH
jgi:hypothetical protein